MYGEPIYSAEEVARSLKFTPETVMRWLRNGKMRGYKKGNTWKIPESAVKEFIEQQQGEIMSEKMAELKIKLPARWVDFIEDFYQVTGLNRDKDMMSTIESNIRGLMLEDDRLSIKDRVRLVEKHNLSDIYEIPQWVRDAAAGA